MDTPTPDDPGLRRAPPVVTVPTPRLEIQLSIDDRKFDRVIELLETILTQQQRLFAQGVRTVASIQELKTKADAILADVQSETEVATSVETLLTGQTALLVDLKAQLDAAIANNDPAALQAVSDAMDTIGSTNAFNKQRVVDAVVANTPAANRP